MKLDGPPLLRCEDELADAELEYPDPEAPELLELNPMPMAHFLPILIFSTARLASPAAAGPMPMPPDAMLMLVCRKEVEAEGVDAIGGEGDEAENGWCGGG